MRRQRKMFQMKEQGKKKPGEKTNEKLSNLLDKVFKALVLRILTELGKRIDEHSENFNKELENIKKETKE